ncbi:signal peptidase I [Actinoplanes rectilineatus]|uniref:signal peptidase I n=1 Tax=Actinoplanes rectilineatus TaxID=113571 RepID=UPI0006975381|nr:signal peptidase I [Actinoplanes rectilineatus]
MSAGQQFQGVTTRAAGVTGGWVRQLAYLMLVVAVRGRKERGGEWGEATLAEFAETKGSAEAVRWAAGGLRVARMERRAARRELPRMVRIRRVAVLTVLIGVLGGLAVDRWVLSVNVVLSGSMEPGYQILDRYLTDRVAYRVTGVANGDVVEYGEAGKKYRRIDRIIGMPGDAIECRDGAVWRNGIKLNEPYLLRDAPEESDTICTPVTIPEGKVYVLGDHRMAAQDSRELGLIDQDDITGRVVGRIWRA